MGNSLSSLGMNQRRREAGGGAALVIVGIAALALLARQKATGPAQPGGSLGTIAVSQRSLLRQAARMRAHRLSKDPTNQPVNVGVRVTYSALNSAGTPITWPFRLVVSNSSGIGGALVEDTLITGVQTLEKFWTFPLAGQSWETVPVGSLITFTVQLGAAVVGPDGVTPDTTRFNQVAFAEHTDAVLRAQSFLPGKLPPCADYGDVNGDGQVDNFDVEMILRHVTRSITLTPDQFRRADVNGDGAVDVRDAQLIQRYLAGLNPTFPRCQQLIFNP